MQHNGLQGLSETELRQRLLEKNSEIRRIRAENTRILRLNLIPLLDDILTIGEEVIASLEEFADVLLQEQLDAGIRYQVCSALVTYARMKEKRNLLIKELQMTGMALYGLFQLSGEGCSDASFLTGVLGIDKVEKLRERKEELLSFLYHGSLMHDIGKLKMLDLYEVPNRSWISEEEELHCIHTSFGYEILKRCPSTQAFASVALGHHSWYDGKGGYPEEYRREEIRDAALVDIIAVADFVDQSCNPIGNYHEDFFSFDEMLHQLRTFRGTRFAPEVVDAVLRQEEAIRETEGIYWDRKRQ